MKTPPTVADASETASSSAKICVVCGDKSYGLNFNAITCESCKAFFRRNALSAKPLVCPFSNSCTVTRVTRRFCQKCRLVKCFGVGMNKEHIMSEEDKLKKRRKIEINRARKKATTGTRTQNGDEEEEPPVKVKREVVDGEDSRSAAVLHSSLTDDLSNSNASSTLDVPSTSTPSSSKDMLATSSQSTKNLEDTFVYPTLESSPTEIVNSIIDSPVGSGRIITHLMKTPQDAILVMEKIINSPKDAIQIISHFINSPGDALKIISKIMNSPFDALTIFTKFMSSPTDALEVITKVISSPNDVLQFLQQLMRSPEDGLEIMNKFMNAPAEALRMINCMMQSKVDSTTADEGRGDENAAGSSSKEATTKAPLIEIQPSDSIMNNSAQLKVILDRMGEQFNGGSPTSSNIPTSSTTDVELETEEQQQVVSMEERNSSEGGECVVEENSAEFQSNSVDLPPFPLPLGGSFSSGGLTTTQDIIDMCVNESVGNSMDTILSEAIKLEYECAMPSAYGMPNVSPSSMYLSPTGAGGSGGDVRALNDVEQAKLNELILAHQALYAPVNEDISSLIADDYRLKQSDQQGGAAADPQLLTLINLTAVAIRRLIKMSKKISAFKNMCQEDQVGLLKGGCTEMMMLRSVMQYDSDNSSWKIPHSVQAMSNLRADILKLARGPVYEEHERFILTFDPKLRQDENIILIMCAIILFTPDRPKTIHSDVIKLEQNSYYYLLRRYLESVYPGCEAKSTFIRLIQKVHELRKFNEAVISVYLDVNPAEVEPLLREIFDLKNQ